MEIKKNDKFTVTIEDMGEDGAGIGRVALPASCASSPRQKAAWRRNVRWRELAADASFRNWTIKNS